MWLYLEYIVKRPYYNIIMKSLTLRGLLWVIGTVTSAYHNYYLSEVWDVVISPNPNSYWSELSLQQCFILKSLLISKINVLGP